MLPPPSSRRRPGPLKAWMRRRGYHVLFAVAILSLLALVVWWSVFIRASIQQHHDLELESMKLSATLIAKQLGQDPQHEPKPGPPELDHRLEIRKQEAAGLEHAVIIAPAWPEYCIAPRPELIAELERQVERQVLMVTGESTTLLFVVLVCVFMLWRMMRLEHRASRQLHDFWGRVTHEFKTPITGIKAFLQTLQHREFTKEELAPLVKLALREVERQEMLAENLLLGQRLDHREIGLGVRRVHIVQAVQDFLEEHRIILPDNDLKFSVQCPPETEVLADPDALRVILENLTDNALKYGGKEPELTYTISAADKHALITISDRGIGFNPASAGQIFEAYERLSEEQPQGKHGTGMGLYLSRRLARRMGGELTAHSDGPATGASFTLSLRSVEPA